jgi:hypothetical protein
MRNFVTQKVTEFHEIPRNSTNSVIRNSAEFRAIPYTIRNFKKHTEFRKHPRSYLQKSLRKVRFCALAEAQQRVRFDAVAEYLKANFETVSDIG